jgi:isopenicillin N synthase-like dioxygenase
MTGPGVVVVDYRGDGAPAQLAESLRTTGFAVVVDHPIPAELISGVQREWLAWFDSAPDVKDRYLPTPGHQDGFHPMTSSERAVGHNVADLKEFFHWYPWGRHPDGLSSAAADLHAAGSTLATELVGWLEANTPPEVTTRFSRPLSRMLDGSTRTLLRILRYPPITGSEPEGAVRAAPHEDINLITILPAADAPGLQVQDQGGHWHDVPADPGSVVINAGDMLELASGGYYPSTTHRVVNPAGPDAGRSRMATPLFLHPADEVELAPGFTAFDFLSDRLRQIRGVGLTRS